MILKGTCHYGGHSWKDGNKVGETIFVYSRTLPKPYAKGQHPRVGNTIHTATEEHFVFKRASIIEVIKLAPAIIRDISKRPIFASLLYG